jgi:hypothetical protein
MEYRNFYSEFLTLYESVYSEIVLMMKKASVTRLELPYDEDYGYDKITIRNEFYGNTDDTEVTLIELVGNDLYFENENEHSYEVSRCVEGAEITTLYDIVYRALFENN